jgi:hypothetical protein
MSYMKAIPTHVLHKWNMWRYLTCFLGLLKSEIVPKPKSSPIFHILATWSFESFLKKKHRSLYTPQRVLSNHSVCMKPHERHLNFCLSHNLPLKALSGVLGRYESGHTCITYFAKSKTGPQGDARHTLWSRRLSVWNVMFRILHIFVLLESWLSLFDWCLLLKVWAIYISLFWRASKYPLFYHKDTIVSIFFMPFWHGIF